MSEYRYKKIKLNKSQLASLGTKTVGINPSPKLVEGCIVTEWNTSCVEDGICMNPKNPNCIKRALEKQEIEMD